MIEEQGTGIPLKARIESVVMPALSFWPLVEPPQAFAKGVRGAGCTW